MAAQRRRGAGRRQGADERLRLGHGGSDSDTETQTKPLSGRTGAREIGTKRGELRGKHHIWGRRFEPEKGGKVGCVWGSLEIRRGALGAHTRLFRTVDVHHTQGRKPRLLRPCTNLHDVQISFSVLFIRTPSTSPVSRAFRFTSAALSFSRLAYPCTLVSLSEEWIAGG